jgi:hypothetical protein
MKKKSKQKIDVVLESLLNLETVIKELIKTVEKLQHKPSDELTIKPVPNKWPNIDPPFKYKDIMWNDNSSSKWDAIDNGWQ